MNYVVNPLSTPLPQIGAVPAIQFDLVNTRSNLGTPQDRCDNNCGCGDSTSCGCTAAARDCECSSSTMNGPFAKAKEWVEEQVEKVKEKVGDATEKAEKAKEDAKEAITGVFEDAGKVVGDGDSKFGNWWQEHTDGEWGDKWANRLTGVYDSFTDGETPWLDEHTDGEFREQFGAWWQEHTDGEWGGNVCELDYVIACGAIVELLTFNIYLEVHVHLRFHACMYVWGCVCGDFVHWIVCFLFGRVALIA